jgi:PEGA domain
MSMKRLILAMVAFAALVAVAAPLSAAPRRGHRGFHRRPAVIVRPWYWGWGFGGYWYDPYWYGYGPYHRGYYGRYGYGYGPSGNWAVVDTDVSPESARVYLDGQYIGTADDFDGHPDYLYLRRGSYRLEFRLEGFESREIAVDARPGVKVDVGDKLARVPGAPRYGTYDNPEPRGGVRRFWAKRRNVSVEVTDQDEIYGDDRRYSRERPREGDESDDEYAEDRDRDRRDTDTEVEREREAAPPPRPREEWRGRGGAEQADTRLVLDVRPSDASIYLDDRFIGTASELSSDAGVAVAPGRHTLVVSRPGYRDRRIEVDVSESETERVEVTLER